MKLRIAIATAGLGIFAPVSAFAAEGGEAATSWFQLIFYVINFLLFVYVVKRYGGQLITNFFRDRAATIRETITRAEANFKEAQELAEKAVDRMNKLEAEKQQITSDLADETVYQIRRIYELAQETAARVKRDSEMTAGALHEAAQRRLRESLAEASGRLARDLLTRDFQPADQRRLLSGFIEKLGEEARR